jgi:hypothetical protein
MRPHLLRRCLVAAGVLVVSVPRSGRAQLDSTFLSRLSIHGYLTLGYGISGAQPQLGLPTDGSVDYDRAALLGQFALASHSHLVVQVAHRDLGTENSLFNEPTFILDWAYFEQRFGDNTRLRVGQEPLPIGIYNEIRYVGTLLPFYRAPYTTYSEGSYTQENLQGLIFTQTIEPHGKFPVDFNAWAGQYNYAEKGTVTVNGASTTASVPATAHNVVGSWVWVRTPIDGFRFGGGIMHYVPEGGVTEQVLGKSDETDSYASVDATFDRFQVRSELSHALRSGGKLNSTQGYAQIGVKVIDPLTLNAQLELQHVHYAVAPGYAANADLQHDFGFGADVALPWSAVFKLEGHATRGYDYDTNPSVFGPPTKGSYGIASLAFIF